VIFGLAPAFQFSKPDLNHALKEGAAVSGRGFQLWQRHRTQSLLVISEIALTLMLLACAGLLARSFWQLQQIKPGFQPEKLLTLQFEFPWYRYRAETMVNSFVTILSENLPTLPGVESVGSTSGLPFTGSGMFSHFSIEGRPNIDENTDEDSPFDAISPPPPPRGASSGPTIRPLMGFNSQVSPGYFRTMGLPLRRGREFDPHDNEHSPPVVIINEAMAQRYWPGEDPLGKRIKMGGGAFHPLDDNCRSSWERQALCIGRKDEAVVLPAIPANR
jgi:putative ABC transport system permease protein